MSDARRIIAQLRDGATPAEADLRWFAQGLASGAVSDAQAGAFAMAVVLRGLDEGGRVALTMAMRDSGKVLGWDLPGPVVDKHSTGGVGDSISLLLAPALAECGVFVPMISGRGLGHTGGTLDKLEAIPGYRCDLPEVDFRRIVARTGCAIVAAGQDLAPADRRLYAVRDVTATVESIELITASILSKKLAAGLQGLVLDVKCGSGAFLPGRDDAEALAHALVGTAQGAGCKAAALITDMDRPLARNAGNALEIIEVMETLTGTRIAPRLFELTVALGGALLALCGAAPDIATGEAQIRAALQSGAAAARFGAMVAAQGAPADFVENWRAHLPTAPVIRPVYAPFAGVIGQIDTRAVGEVVVHLGGGRLREGGRIDASVGLSDLVPPGEAVGPGQPLALIHAADGAAAERAAQSLVAAFEITDTPPPFQDLILSRVN